MGKDRNKIIEDLYADKDISNAIAKMQPAHLQDDLRQEMFLVLCELEEKRLFEMHTNGYLKFYLVKTMLTMMKSDRSTFYNKYRKTLNEINETILNTTDVPDTVNEEMIQKANAAFNELHWYQQGVFRLYSENGNISELSRETKIPYRSLSKTISDTKQKLKKALKTENNQQKLIGNYVYADLNLVIDVNKETTPEEMADLMEEIQEYITQRIAGKIKNQAMIREIKSLKIKRIV